MAASRREFTKAERAHYGRVQREDYARLRELNKAHAFIARKPITRILAGGNEYMSITAVFEKRDGAWRCKEASHDWLKRLHVMDVKNELLRRGMKWEWLTAS